MTRTALSISTANASPLLSSSSVIKTTINLPTQLRQKRLGRGLIAASESNSTMYNLIEAREVNWRRGLGGGVGGRYNCNVGAGSITNNNNLSAEDRKHEQTEELFLNNPPPLRGGDGG